MSAQDHKILIYYIIGIIGSIPMYMILFEIGRLATFLFYDKKDKVLNKSNVLKPLVGRHLLYWKNILLVCFVGPAFYLFRTNQFGSFSGKGYAVLFGIAIFILIFLSAAELLRRKLQPNQLTRKQALIRFVIEIAVFILLGFLLVKYYDFVNEIQMLPYQRR